VGKIKVVIINTP